MLNRLKAAVTLNSFPRLSRAHALNYASVVVSVILAFVVRWPFQSLLESRAAFVTIYPAVIYSAWNVGFWGGCFATALSTLGIIYLILPPLYSFRAKSPADIVSVLLYVAVGIGISALGQAQKTARDRAAASVKQARESTRRVAAMATELTESEARKSAVLEVALDCIITMDSKGCITEFNPAAEKTFGYTRNEVIGCPVADTIIPLHLRMSHKQGLKHYLETGEGPVIGKRVEVIGMRKDSTEFPVELAVVAMGHGASSGFTAYLRDISEQKQEEQEREQLTLQVQAAAERQRLFLHDVLASVTEGRLHLCHTSADLPQRLLSCGSAVELTQSSGLKALRQSVQTAAGEQGFDEERWHDLVTAASEAGMNAIVHAGGGTGEVCSDGHDLVQVWIQDQGTGIDLGNLPRATLGKGFTTAGTLGHGMKIMLQTIDRLYLLTGATGTTVALEMDRVSPPSFW